MSKRSAKHPRRGPGRLQSRMSLALKKRKCKETPGLEDRPGNGCIADKLVGKKKTCNSSTSVLFQSSLSKMIISMEKEEQTPGSGS